MLHTLWLILKIILILLGIILGIVLLLLLLVLFCPIRYRVYAEKAETDSFKEAEARAKVSWLFGGVSANAAYKDGAPEVFIKLLFLKKELLGKKKAPEEHPHPVPEKPEASTGPELSEKPELSDRPELSEKPELTEMPELPEKPESVIPEQETGDSDIIEIEPIPAESAEAIQIIQGGKEEDSAEKEPDSGENVLPDETVPDTPAVSRKKSIFSKISDVVGSIKNKISGVKKKVSGTVTKLNWWKEFIFHPKTKAAAALVLTKAKFLIRHVLPTRIYGRLRAGFEDPSITGRMLAYLGMSYPLHRNRIAVTPVFENRTVVDGEVTVKGRIYLIVFAAAAVRILLSRNVRFVLKKFKNRNKEVS